MTDETEKTLEIPILDQELLHRAANVLAGEERLTIDPENLTARHRAWIKWFGLLSEDDKKVVERCARSGVTVTPANFAKAKAIVKAHFPDN